MLATLPEFKDLLNSIAIGLLFSSHLHHQGNGREPMDIFGFTNLTISVSMVSVNDEYWIHASFPQGALGFVFITSLLHIWLVTSSH